MQNNKKLFKCLLYVGTSFPSSSKHFYSIVPLAIDKDIQVNDVFEAQNELIKPFELSTRKNASLMNCMHFILTCKL